MQLANEQFSFCQDINLKVWFILQKIARRLSVVEWMDWDDAKKDRCWKYLTIDYTSSDERELSEDEPGTDVKRFVTKRLAWESPKLRELKENLDRQYRTC